MIAEKSSSERMKRTRGVAKGSERSVAPAAPEQHRPVDDLRFTPASYADVTLQPGERFDAVRDLLAQHVPHKVQIAHDLKAEAMAFARQMTDQFKAEQAAKLLARQTIEQYRAELAQQKAQEQAAQALEARLSADKLQAERQAAAKLLQEQQKDKGRDRGGWSMSM